MDLSGAYNAIQFFDGLADDRGPRCQFLGCHRAENVEDFQKVAHAPGLRRRQRTLYTVLVWTGPCIYIFYRVAILIRITIIDSNRNFESERSGVS